jgi:hypothetical protein
MNAFAEMLRFADRLFYKVREQKVEKLCVKLFGESKSCVHVYNTCGSVADVDTVANSLSIHPITLLFRNNSHSIGSVVSYVNI